MVSTTALAIIQPDDLDVIQRTARLLAVSGYFDGKGDTPVAIAMMATKILAGREIGIGPFASVNGIHIISGKPAIGANLMASAVKSSGRYDYRVLELNEKVCKIEYRQRNGEKWEAIGISEFTAEDARKAGTKNMDKYPKNMLFARAMSNGVRFYCPDIFSGNVVYVPEELGADVDVEGNVITVETAQERPQAQQAVSQAQSSLQASKTSQQPATQATEDKITALRRERRNIEMSDLSKDHEARELARLDAEIAKIATDAVDSDVLFERDATPTELAIIQQWGNRTEAEMWAVMTGACANEFEARTSMSKSINAYGGKVTKDNYLAIYTHFLRRQQEKLQAQAVAA